MNTTDFDKLKITARYWLVGKAENDARYYLTLKALDIMLQFHTGLRKDGETHEAYHQLNIFSMLRALAPQLEQPATVLAVALLHDTYEDYPDSHEVLMREVPELMPYLVRVSKVRDGQKISYDQYFGGMTQCPVTSVVKLVDRIHNLSTMAGVFSEEKEAQYVQDVYDYFYPMIKRARRLHPQQESAYELLKSTLSLLVHSIEFRLGIEQKEVA
jgi:(p)ppGpp synthase/HD superfamily hydrolase